jgi:SAM-dependent methyltransferase
LSRALAFLSGDRPLDYGARLSRLRWRRALAAETAMPWDPAGPAAAAIAGADVWVVVADSEALPAFGGPPGPVPGRVLVTGEAVPERPAFVHTPRELEGAALRPAEGPAPGREPAALLFRAADFPPGAYETVKLYVNRLLSSKAFLAVDPAFLVVRLDEPSDRERPELTRRVPGGVLRILDVGCGAGAGIASAKVRHPAWNVTGIEWDPDLAARARVRCDRVLEGDLARILPALEKDGELFDALVFADVLEHLEDPVAALAAGRRVAAAGARLIVSVPNVGHLSIARDLVAGRFDPIPAGLTDARHLRWFTRTFLAEALEESGWRMISIESEAGAPAPDTAAFLALAAQWPDRDLESLATYQWIAVAGA